jgi:glycosyltransferase involved in cell wall biosynthesis
VSVPELSVVVASHDRPLRLRWLLNALSEQTLEPSRWEVIVCHDSAGEETDRVLSQHPLAASERLRWTRLRAGTALPGTNRNAAIELARADTLVFTDDDCRPPENWLEHVLAAVRRHPGAVVQGAVAPDPDEQAMLRCTHPRSQSFSDVPRPWAECCNIAYPQRLVEAAGGFVEDVATGEDADLNQRVRAGGAEYVGDLRMLTYHGVEEGMALDAVRDAWRWGDLALLFKRHPELRRELYLGVFWKRSHATALLALAGALAFRRGPLRIVLAIPWVVSHRSGRSDLRGAVRDVLELPGWAAVDLAEALALGRGSLRHHALLL